MLLSAQTSHLLIVDMQERLIPVMDDPGTAVSGCVKLARGAGVLGVPILVSQQYPAGIGPTIDEIKKELPDQSSVIDKISFSCLREVALSKFIDDAAAEGKTQWILAGIETHVCVLQSALDLKKQGHDVAVVADAVSSRTTFSKEKALQRMAQAGVIIATVEMILFEWLEKAGTAQFKTVSALIK